MAKPVVLHNIIEFEKLLEHYHVSSHAQSILDKAKLVVLTGLAGGGRNSTINHLVKNADYFFIVSDTTRPPKIRDGKLELTGVHYYFRSEIDMLSDIQNGEFIEAEIIHNQQVSGTSIRELERANSSGKIAIHDFEYGGAKNVAAAKSDAYLIGLLPPTYEEWLRRLQAREEMHEEELLNRLRTAEKVLTNMLSEPYFKFVVNTTIEQCANDIRQIVESNVVDLKAQGEARTVAFGLLTRVQGRIKSL